MSGGREVLSFGQRRYEVPEAEPELEELPVVEQQTLPTLGRVQLEADVALSPESLEKLQQALGQTVEAMKQLVEAWVEQDLPGLISRAVLAGFAMAAGEQKN